MFQCWVFLVLHHFSYIKLKGGKVEEWKTFFLVLILFSSVFDFFPFLSSEHPKEKVLSLWYRLLEDHVIRIHKLKRQICICTLPKIKLILLKWKSGKGPQKYNNLVAIEMKGLNPFRVFSKYCENYKKTSEYKTKSFKFVFFFSQLLFFPKLLQDKNFHFHGTDKENFGRTIRYGIW